MAVTLVTKKILSGWQFILNWVWSEATVQRRPPEPPAVCGSDQTTALSIHIMDAHNVWIGSRSSRGNICSFSIKGMRIKQIWGWCPQLRIPVTGIFCHLVWLGRLNRVLSLRVLSPASGEYSIDSAHGAPRKARQLRGHGEPWTEYEIFPLAFMLKTTPRFEASLLSYHMLPFCFPLCFAGMKITDIFI